MKRHFQTILDEAQESYKPEIVFELSSNSPDEMETNLNKIQDWVKQWKIEKTFLDKVFMKFNF